MELVPKEKECLLRFIQAVLVLKLQVVSALRIIVSVSFGSVLISKKNFLEIVLSRIQLVKNTSFKLAPPIRDSEGF